MRLFLLRLPLRLPRFLARPLARGLLFLEPLVRLRRVLPGLRLLPLRGLRLLPLLFGFLLLLRGRRRGPLLRTRVVRLTRWTTWLSGVATSKVVPPKEASSLAVASVPKKQKKAAKQTRNNSRLICMGPSADKSVNCKLLVFNQF